MYLKDDASEFLDDYKLESMVKKYSEFITFPIYLRKTKSTTINAEEEEDYFDEDGEDDEEDLDEEEDEGEEEVRACESSPDKMSFYTSHCGSDSTLCNFYAVNFWVIFLRHQHPFPLDYAHCRTRRRRSRRGRSSTAR